MFQEQAMLRLQTACADIPALTTATKELHESVTTLVLDAHNIQQQEKKSVGSGAAGAPIMMMPPGRPGTASANFMVRGLLAALG